MEIVGFPTIKLFPADDKANPVDYTGSRTVEDLANFIKEHGTHHIGAYVAPPPEPEAEGEPADETPGHAAPAASKVEEAAEKATEAADDDVRDVLVAWLKHRFSVLTWLFFFLAR
jgi:protein disulfide-isomerase A1